MNDYEEWLLEFERINFRHVNDLTKNGYGPLTENGCKTFVSMYKELRKARSLIYAIDNRFNKRGVMLLSEYNDLAKENEI